MTNSMNNSVTIADIQKASGDLHRLHGQCAEQVANTNLFNSPAQRICDLCLRKVGDRPLWAPAGLKI